MQKALQLLATELGLSRSRITALLGAGRLTVDGGGNALKRSPRHGQSVRLDLDGADDIVLAATKAGSLKLRPTQAPS